MNKKISAVVTLVGLILIMCAMAVLFHNKKEDMRPPYEPLERTVDYTQTKLE